jgi:glutamyl/glutaminyl-tRNA synthetase
VLGAPGAREVVLGLADALRDFAPFEDKAVEERIRKFCEEKALKTGAVFHPLRAAVSGRTEGPTLFKMLEVLGRDTVVARLKDAASRIN